MAEGIPETKPPTGQLPDRRALEERDKARRTTPQNVEEPTTAPADTSDNPESRDQRKEDGVDITVDGISKQPERKIDKTA